MRALAVAALLLLPASAGGQTTRWAVRIYAPNGIEHGELRLEGNGGRLLLERRDSAFFPISQLERSGVRLTFAVAALGATMSAELISGGKQMDGVVLYPNGARINWQGEEIVPGTVRWPVRPRLRVHQLLFGSAADVTIIPADWVRALPDSARLEREYQLLVARINIPEVPPSARATRSSAIVLGWEPTTRNIVRGVFERIAAGPTADTSFRRIFLGKLGLRLDVHERAEEAATQRDPTFRFDNATRALVLGGFIPATARDEPVRSRAAMLSLWSRWHAEDTLTLARIEQLQLRDRDGWRALKLLLAGYDQAVPWWQEAVVWLLEHRWLETASGPRSPAQLVANFWSERTLPVPTIAPVYSGGFAATPMVSGDRIGQALIEPLNATAREWLGSGRPEALRVWSTLVWDDSLIVGGGARAAVLLAPRTAAERPSLGALLASEDRVEIDPGIMPLFAVATVIHEWHHLLATSQRLQSVKAVNGTVRLEEEDPWLTEGFAEWATEATLLPTRQLTPVLAFVDTEKRMALWGGMSEDPHALGYRLVRAAADRLPSGQRRQLLMNHLHDPARVASLAGFGRGATTPPLLLRRPMTLGVIPEIVFTWDAGVADHPTRRLVLPLFPPEH